MKIFAPFFYALGFLTCLPVPVIRHIDDVLISRSLIYYPLVGLIIGAILGACGWLLYGAPTGIVAVLMLVAWVLLTGALHLDGLADSADALLGGHGSAEKSLEIMKDPRAGSAAVAAVVLVLLAKFSALEALIRLKIPSVMLIAVIISAVVARFAVAILLITTPYVRNGGLGAALHSVQRLSFGVVSVIVLVMLGLLSLFVSPIGIQLFIVIIGVSVLVGLAVRMIMLRCIGGTTGDTAGAFIEIIEMTGLLASALLAASYTV